MSQGQPIKDRRKKCDDCSTGEISGLVTAVSDLTKKVSKILGASWWQKTIIVLLLGGGLAGSTGSIYVVVAKANIDGKQNTDIALANQKIDTLTESVEDLVDVIQDDKDDLREYREEQRKRQEAEHKAFLEALERVGE